MYKSILTVLAILGCLIGDESLIAQPVFSDSTLVHAKIWSRDANRNIQYSDWKNFSSHTVSQLQGFSAASTDPSNRDANKGLVNTQYQLYVPLGNRMKELNMNKYRLATFIFASAKHL